MGLRTILRSSMNLCVGRSLRRGRRIPAHPEANLADRDSMVRWQARWGAADEALRQRWTDETFDAQYEPPAHAWEPEVVWPPEAGVAEPAGG